MKLIELELAGFKSFARPTTFRFDNGLTGIIGPNGSGKSNLAEAIRWVLGEQSLKSLRGRQSTDVIFSGSNVYRRTGRARVKLTLSNEDNRIPVAAAEVTITRLIDRSGTSEYLLNNDTVRLADIHQLMAESGLGTKSYTVISQGTIERYLNASPSARRELFDEACGIKPLQLKLARAKRTLTQASQRLAELTAIKQELEPRLKVLGRQVRRHHLRQRLEVEHRRAQEIFFKSSLAAQLQARKIGEQMLSSAQQELDQTRLARESVEADLLQAIHSNPSTDQLAHSSPTPAELLIKAKQEHNQLQIAFEHRQQERADLTASLSLIRQDLALATKQLDTARKAAKQLHIFADLRQLLHRCLQLVNNLQAKHQPSIDNLAQLTRDLSTASRRLDHDNAPVTAAQSLLSRLEGPLQTVARLQALEQDRSERLENSPALPKPTSQALAKLSLKVKQNLSPSTATRDSLARSLDSVRAQELSAAQANFAAQAKLDQVNNNISQLEATILRERGSSFLKTCTQTSTDKASTTITGAKVDALVSRLATLGEIDPLALKEYEEVEARHQELSRQLSDIELSHKHTSILIKSLQRNIQTRFRQQFGAIQESFTFYFKQLFGGGTAQLEIIDSTPETDVDVAEASPADKNAQKSVAGIAITANPPDKNPQHIQLLSGGEKALTSLALLLATIHVQQPPFIVFDEVDAALDEANSYRFAEILKKISQSTQCIVITHNRETMGNANVLYGITMAGDGVSRSFSVRLNEVNATADVNKNTKSKKIAV